MRFWSGIGLGSGVLLAFFLVFQTVAAGNIDFAANELASLSWACKSPGISCVPAGSYNCSGGITNDVTSCNDTANQICKAYNDGTWFATGAYWGTGTTRTMFGHPGLDNCYRRTYRLTLSGWVPNEWVPYPKSDNGTYIGVEVGCWPPLDSVQPFLPAMTCGSCLVSFSCAQCNNECTAGATRCSGSSAQVCSANSNGCLSWQNVANCGAASCGAGGTRYCNAAGDVVQDQTCSGGCNNGSCVGDWTNSQLVSNCSPGTTYSAWSAPYCKPGDLTKTYHTRDVLTKGCRGAPGTCFTDNSEEEAVANNCSASQVCYSGACVDVVCNASVAPTPILRNNSSTYTGAYQGFVAKPGTGPATLNCGNNSYASIGCTDPVGTNGTCTADCAYPTAGTFTTSSFLLSSNGYSATCAAQNVCVYNPCADMPGRCGNVPLGCGQFDPACNNCTAGTEACVNTDCRVISCNVSSQSPITPQSTSTISIGYTGFASKPAGSIPCGTIPQSSATLNCTNPNANGDGTCTATCGPFFTVGNSSTQSFGLSNGESNAACASSVVEVGGVSGTVSIFIRTLNGKGEDVSQFAKKDTINVVIDVVNNTSNPIGGPGNDLSVSFLTKEENLKKRINVGFSAGANSAINIDSGSEDVDLKPLDLSDGIFLLRVAIPTEGPNFSREYVAEIPFQISEEH